MPKETETKAVRNMPTLFDTGTYQIEKPHTSPLVKGFLYFLIFLLLFLTVSQWVGHSSLNTQLPPPTLDANIPSFNVKMNYLDNFVRQNGKLDCLLFGSSHILNGLDPVIVGDVYQEQTGRKIKCFNFGLETLTADTAGPLLQALVEKYQPSLVIFEISARSFSSDFGDLTRSLQYNAWVQQLTGNTSLEGWVLEHVFGYRYFLTFKTWQLPQNRKVMINNWHSIDVNGYAPVPATETLTNPSVRDIRFKIDPSNWAGFTQVLALQGGTNIVFLEAPIQESYLPHYLMGGVETYESEFIKPVTDELSMHGILFWRALKEVSPLLGDDMWVDPRHVNVDGASIFSNWVGNKMAQIIPPETFR